jgi:hypothetical protein
MMSPLLPSRSFEVYAVNELSIGQTLPPFVTGHDGPTMIRERGWSLPTGAYTARQIVENCAPLLETVLHHLGPDPQDQTTARQMLLDNLASNLALGTRESSLDVPLKDPSRKEFAAQAVKIGKALVSYARETRDVSFDPEYTIRSPCEGHLLKPAVAQLMFGPRSLAHLMQIYNEYLHQMVLLRDALLPFENFDQVVIPVQSAIAKGRLGMRFTEAPRMVFIAELMTKLTTQASVLKLAQSVLIPELSSENSYGFQYKYGLILPTSVIGGSSLRLLRYIPSVLDDSVPEVTFEYMYKDYYSASRSEIAAAEQTLDKGQVPELISGDQQHDFHSHSFSLAPGSSATSRQLRLHLDYDNGVRSTTDVGQISRGFRYSYKVSTIEDKSEVMSFNFPASVHTAMKVLTSCDEDSLLTAQDGGRHLIQATSRLEILALLGCIYPDNIIVLKSGASLKDAEEAGQSLPGEPRFVLQVVEY